jgi:signal transduction histidine kinase/ActR/RegA family two-component response regulator
MMNLRVFSGARRPIRKNAEGARWFEDERKKVLRRAVQIGALLAIVLVLLFAVLDYFFKPRCFDTFLALRLGTVFLAAVILALTRTLIGFRRPYVLGALLCLIVAGSISIMCLLDLGPADPYYAGINLPILAFGILFPLTFAEGLSVLATAWLMYFLPNALILRPPDAPVFLSNNFFMVSTLLISLVASQFHLQYRKREWLSRRNLEKAHRKIRLHSRELEQKVEERTRTLIQSERLAVVGQLSGGIAHDFNNHLTAILGISELLLNRRNLPRAVSDDLAGIRSAGLRASQLVKQLLAFSRQQIINPRLLDLNETVTDVRQLLSRLIGEDIELVIQSAPDLLSVRVDPVQAEQILLNLAVNARDAMPKGGRLFIETSNVRLERAYCRARNLSLAPGRFVMVAVSDNGCGMPEDVKNRIFEPFFTTKGNDGGTGLGLSTVYGIVRQARGDILVYSEVGVGTTIKIFLPGLDEKLAGLPDSPEVVDMPKGRETILLVEDEESIRGLTARLLRQQGYRVIQASEGHEALDKVNSVKGPIHLLMTDVVMPLMNGPDLARRLLSEHQAMKVLYFSGYTDAFIIRKGMIEPGSHFLQKPFTFEALSTKVRETIDRDA